MPRIDRLLRVRLREQLVSGTGPRFEWWRPRKGWVLMDGSQEKSRPFRKGGALEFEPRTDCGRFLVPVLDTADDYAWANQNSGEVPYHSVEWYRPELDGAPIFFQTSNRPFQESAILQFFQDFGSPDSHLDFGITPIQPLPPWAALSVATKVIGYKVNWAGRLLSTLGHAVAVWRAYVDRDADTLRELLAKTLASIGRQVTHDELFEIARAELSSTTTSWLSETGPVLSLGIAERDFEMHMMPRTLLGFLWFQFADAIAGERPFRRCVSCSTWMAAGPDSANSNKQYCSNACRMRAYRRRKSNPHSVGGEA